MFFYFSGLEKPSRVKDGKAFCGKGVQLGARDSLFFYLQATSELDCLLAKRWKRMPQSRLLWFLLISRVNLSPFTKDFRGEEHHNESIDNLCNPTSVG